MSILFGHPSGNPFAHHAALAHYQAGWLESFCVPWMPSPAALRVMNQIAPLRPMVSRLSRRYFAPLAGAPKTQGRMGEWLRLARRALGGDADVVAVEANEWLMRTMAGLTGIPRVTAVHAYEDCSLRQFRRARQLGKACIYDLPIGYYAAWDTLQASLAKRYSAWLPSAGVSQPVAREHKREEMQLADLVLAPSAFVAGTIRDAGVTTPIVVAPFGVDAAGWTIAPDLTPGRDLTFLFVGQCSVRKGVPLLLDAWRAAALRGARLQLVGPWRLAEAKKKDLPPDCSWSGPVSSGQLRAVYAAADVFVFPTNFEGRALVVGEALASGLPVLTTKASGMDDAVDESCGQIIAADSLEELVESLRRFAREHERLPALRRAARAKAEALSWDKYRAGVADAVRPFAGGAAAARGAG
jgi:glycosyltransferase involved in cell wall biosynthesis